MSPILENETRPAVPTGEAARLLGRKPQTLRVWACHESGPLRPVKVYGRLLWPVAEIRRLLNGEQPAR
nr:helix-turn-helix domain-containing protein [Chloracidobacterium thermophilum]